MEKGLLVVERMVLESISKGHSKEESIASDTGLKNNLVRSITYHLLERDILYKDSKGYKLNSSRRAEWLELINSTESIKAESIDLFSSLVNMYFEKDMSKNVDLGVKNIFLTPSEELILNSMFINIKTFIEDKERNSKDKGRYGNTGQERLILWGKGLYQQVAENSLAS